MEDNVIVWFLDRLDEVLNQYVADTYAALSAHYAATVMALLGLMVVLWGIAKLLALGQRVLEDFIVRVVALPVFVVVFATDWSVYSIFLYDLITNGTDEMVSVINRGQPVWEQLGNLFDLLVDSTWAITAKGSWGTGFFWFLLGLIYLLTAIVMTGLALFVMTAAKIATALLLALGPVFLILILFETLRPIAAGWLRAVLGFSLTAVLITALLKLVLDIIYRPVYEVAVGLDEPHLGLIMSHLLIMGIAGTLFAAMPVVAALITSGVALRVRTFALTAVGVATAVSRELRTQLGRERRNLVRQSGS